MAQQTIETVVSDTAPDITFNITRDDGSIVDLTGAVVRFRILDPKTNQRTNDTANICQQVTPAAGICRYSWNNTDCPDPGIYKADLQITYPTAEVETYQMRIKVSAHV